MITYLAYAMAAFFVTLISTRVLIPYLKKSGITGKDENKADEPEIPEMGGIAIVAGLVAGLLLAIFLDTFLGYQINMVYILAATITIISIAFIGMVDDLVSLPQWVKALLPLFAAVPLVAVKAAASTAITIPFIGMVDFGLLYIVVLVPLAIAVCSNLTNMLAGFNGMEAGMGAVMFAALAILAITHQSHEMAVISLSMLGALLAFEVFNFYPAKIFPGDVGNLTIGAVLATAVIIGNFESAGLILMIPYAIDFLVKAKNKFPHTHQDVKGGKLYPKDGKVRGFVHVVMAAFNGITERGLTLFFMNFEAVFAIIVLILFLR
ncbi:UDP-N-acetylglucosamine--dolichyl-phosphate N-acetylglucosaminephosphotransferase [Candidatus Micrarchaeota archaeon]|nr:UDP-N-acetylglucosamine--dolichyl-phosphate N-acetylglucosaminephosphotransferase [Candidatus Micrarchaeota archaeon]